MAAKRASRLQGSAELSHRTQRVGDRVEPELGSRPCPRPLVSSLGLSVRAPEQRAEERKARSSCFQTQPGYRVRETSAVSNGLSWEIRGSGRRWR